VLLKTRDGNKFLPIWIGHPEAAAILMKLQGANTPRPMTHDLMDDMLTELDIACSRVAVTELKENTFYAVIHLRAVGQPVVVDARPSDAIALALRSGAPIFVDEAVIASARSVESSKESMDVGRLQKWLENLSDEELGKYKM
jgi:bifunctional DNase/RNase